MLITQITGTLFFFPYLYLQNIMPLYFSRMMLLQNIMTILFWYNPVKNRNTYIHKIDSIVAKINILSYILYKLFIYKENVIYFSVNTTIMFYFFYLSHKNSSKIWCCRDHIMYHAMAHIISYYSIYLAII